jgi:hypothetical protein
MWQGGGSLLSYGTVQMHMPEDTFWFCPLGLFLDLWELHKQFNGWAKPLTDDTELIESMFPEEE